MTTEPQVLIFSWYFHVSRSNFLQDVFPCTSVQWRARMATFNEILKTCPPRFLPYSKETFFPALSFCLVFDLSLFLGLDFVRAAISYNLLFIINYHNYSNLGFKYSRERVNVNTDEPQTKSALSFFIFTRRCTRLTTVADVQFQKWNYIMTTYDAFHFTFFSGVNISFDLRYLCNNVITNKTYVNGYL